MDLPDLNFNFIQSDIDPATVKPIESQELIRLVNGFLLTSSELVDTFCGAFEQRILTLESRMDSFEKQLLLLERRLVNIPTRTQSMDKNAIVTAAPSDLDNLTAGQQHQPDGIKSRYQSFPTSTSGATKSSFEKSERNDTIQAIEHPIFSKYFRMLRMGVPEPAVKQKMCSEGINPAVLNDPKKLLLLSVKTDQEKQSTSDDGNMQEDCLSSSSSVLPSSSSTSSFD